MSQFTDSAKPKGKFIKFVPNEPQKLKYIGFQEKSTTPDQFTNEDGSFGVWEFQDLTDGQVREYSHKSAANAIHIALKQAGIVEGDSFEIIRSGEGPQTRYTVKKLSATEAAAAKGEVKADQVPF